MWFKQIQLFQLKPTTYNIEALTEKIAALSFIPCFPSTPSSIGWVSPIDEENAPIIRSINGYIMLCMQVEEKILPATVIRQELDVKIKKMEALDSRKIRGKEKLSLKDEVIDTLLPRAFSKLSKIYGYIDTKNNWLVLNTVSTKMSEQFISLFKKSVTEDIAPFDTEKFNDTITPWVKSQQHPPEFGVENACILQDPEHETRMIRCQHQDLFASPIQALIKEGCEVIQLALAWHDRINFVITKDFMLRSIRFQDEIREQVKEMEPETKLQRFDADFYIMSEMFNLLLNELITAFMQPKKLSLVKESEAKSVA